MEIEGYFIQSRQPGSAKPKWGFVGNTPLDRDVIMESVAVLRKTLPNTEWRVMALCHAEDA